jgi:hypothetical protein
MPYTTPARGQETAHRRLLKRSSVWFTLMLGSSILLGAVCLALLTPPITTNAFGQVWSVGAQPPSFSLLGQAQMTEAGVPIPLLPTQTYGPVRMSANAGLFDLKQNALSGSWKHDGDKLAHAWGTWLWHALALFFVLVLGAWLVALKYLRRELLPRSRRLTLLMAVLGSTIVFAGCEAAGTIGLEGVSKAPNLNAIFGANLATVPHQPSPAHQDAVSEGAVIGESVAAHVGGIHARWPCWRSDDSLAYWLGQFTGYAWRNLACSGATIPDGLIGPQSIGLGTKHEVTLPAQVSELANIANLRQVVVAIGPNDLGWTFQMGLCLYTNSCGNHLSDTDFALRLSRLTINDVKLLDSLSKLPTHPHVTVVLQYDLMSPQATSERLHCLDSSSLSPAEIQLMRNYNLRMNQVLQASAAHYHDPVATPNLNELCPASPGSQDIEHIYDSHGHISQLAAHPTPQGERKIARAILKVLPDEASSAAFSRETPQARHL